MSQAPQTDKGAPARAPFLLPSRRLQPVEAEIHRCVSESQGEQAADCLPRSTGHAQINTCKCADLTPQSSIPNVSKELDLINKPTQGRIISKAHTSLSLQDTTYTLPTALGQLQVIDGLQRGHGEDSCNPLTSEGIRGDGFRLERDKVNGPAVGPPPPSGRNSERCKR